MTVLVVFRPLLPPMAIARLALPLDVGRALA
jgi:hypothetical protein